MKRLTALILLLLNIGLLFKLRYIQTILSGSTPLLDFDAYILLIKGAREGIHPYMSESMQTLGPPLVFSYFLPFSFFTLETARILTTLLNIISGILTSKLLTQKYFKNNLNIFLILNLVLFSAFPTRFSLESGQPILFITLMLTLLLTSKNNNLKVFLIAVITCVKTFYIFLIFAFLKNKKLILKTAIYLIFIAIVLLPFIKLDWYIYFLSNKTSSLLNAQPIQNLDYYNQTVFVSISRLGLSSIAVLMQFVISAIILGSASIYSSIPLAIIGSLTISPVSWQHYFVVLFPIFIYLLNKTKFNLLNIIFFILAVLLWWIEFSYLHTAQLSIFNRILASHYLISALITSYLLIKNK